MTVIAKHVAGGLVIVLGGGSERSGAKPESVKHEARGERDSKRQHGKRISVGMRGIQGSD